MPSWPLLSAFSSVILETGKKMHFQFLFIHCFSDAFLSSLLFRFQNSTRTFPCLPFSFITFSQLRCLPVLPFHSSFFKKTIQGYYLVFLFILFLLYTRMFSSLPLYLLILTLPNILFFLSFVFLIFSLQDQDGFLSFIFLPLLYSTRMFLSSPFLSVL